MHSVCHVRVLTFSFFSLSSAGLVNHNTRLKTGKNHMADRNYWKILPAGAALFSLTVFAVSANVIPSILLRAAGDFNISPELMSGATTIQFAGFIVATILGGIFADRVGKKTVFLAACFFTLCGAFMWYCAGSLCMVTFGSLAMGMGGGVLESMSSALLCDLFPKKRKLYLNLSQSAYCIGAAAGPYLIGSLLSREDISWRLVFLLLSAMAFVLLVLYALSHIPKSTDEEKISLQILTRIIGKWSFVCPCLVIFLYVFAETVHMVFINYYLRKHFQAPENWAVYGLSIFWLAMTLGRMLCALIPEAVSYRKIIASLMLFSGLLMFSQLFVQQWQVGIVIFALTGFVFSGTWPLIIGLTAKLNPGYSGTVIGVTVAAGAIGTVAAAPLMGLCFTLLPLQYAFSLASLSLFAGGILIALVRRTTPAPR
jgi:FHS family glucose/mannose:H+ symporter-like MFS transporter